MKAKKKWEKYEIEFLLENYPKYGIEFCSNSLNVEKSFVASKVFYLKLKVNSERKSATQSARGLRHNYPDANIFINITRKEVAYIMGFLWADGYLNETIITLEINKIDLDEIKDVFFKLGEWRYSSRFRKNRSKEVSSVSCCKKEILNVFKNYQYKNKSLVYPIVLRSIPDKLKKYFFRGLIDGDGNFYVNKKAGLSQFCLAGSYGQDWSYFEKLLNELGIKYTIKRKEEVKNNKIHKSSTIRVSRRDDVIKIGDYIYDGFTEDGIGLSRKYEKVLLMKQAKKEREN